MYSCMCSRLLRRSCVLTVSEGAAWVSFRKVTWYLVEATRAIPLIARQEICRYSCSAWKGPAMLLTIQKKTANKGHFPPVSALCIHISQLDTLAIPTWFNRLGSCGTRRLRCELYSSCGESICLRICCPTSSHSSAVVLHVTVKLRPSSLVPYNCADWWSCVWCSILCVLVAPAVFQEQPHPRDGPTGGFVVSRPSKQTRNISAVDSSRQGCPVRVRPSTSTSSTTEIRFNFIFAHSPVLLLCTSCINRMCVANQQQGITITSNHYIKSKLRKIISSCDSHTRIECPQIAVSDLSLSVFQSGPGQIRSMLAHQSRPDCSA